MVDYNSKYSGEQVEALLDQVASGNAGGGGGGINEVYIADFTRESLINGMNNGTNVECDVRALVEAMNANKVILVREAEDSSYKGVYVLNGYAEDLLYFSIVDSNGNILWCEGTDYIYSQFIEAHSLHERSWYSKQDTLVSGENIKTINGESIVGEGDITIAGGSGEKGEKGDKGDTGVGVQSVAQTTTSNADGGSNVVTVTLTDGTKSTFTVKNGSKGSQGVQGPKGDTGATGPKGDKGDTGAAGTNGTNGKDGADGATFTPSVDSAGNLSWSNNKGLTNPPTVNIKGPKGDKGDAGEGGGSGGGKEVVYTGLFFSEDDPMQPNKIYINDNDALMIVGVLAFEQISDYDVYTAIFRWPESGLHLPYETLFADGQSFNIEYGTLCELSIVGANILGERVYSAVLTPFKPV